MKTKNPKKPERLKPISFYPIKWWEVMRYFIQINPKRARKIREKIKD